MLSGEAVNTNLIVFGLTKPWLTPMIYWSRGQHAIHYTGEVVIYIYIYRITSSLCMWYRLTVVYNTYNAGLSIKGGTRYFSPPKMVFGTSWFWKCVVSDIHENCSNFNKKVPPVNSEVLVHWTNIESPDNDYYISWSTCFRYKKLLTKI